VRIIYNTWPPVSCSPEAPVPAEGRELSFVSCSPEAPVPAEGRELSFVSCSLEAPVLSILSRVENVSPVHETRISPPSAETCAVQDRISEDYYTEVMRIRMRMYGKRAFQHDGPSIYSVFQVLQKLPFKSLGDVET